MSYRLYFGIETKLKYRISGGISPCDISPCNICPDSKLRQAGLEVPHSKFGLTWIFSQNKISSVKKFYLVPKVFLFQQKLGSQKLLETRSISIVIKHNIYLG